MSSRPCAAAADAARRAAHTPAPSVARRSPRSACAPDADAAEAAAWPVRFRSARRRESHRAWSRSTSAASMASGEGASNHSKRRGSPPHAITSSTVLDKSTRNTSGSRCGRSRSRASHSRRTTPGRSPRRASCPLIGSVRGNPLDFEAVDPAVRVVPRDFVKAGIDNRGDAGHGHRRLRDVGRDDDATPRRSRRPEREILGVRVERSVKRQNLGLARDATGLQFVDGSTNLERAWQKAQHVAA